jgi:osmotically-inducible protein OsmY
MRVKQFSVILIVAAALVVAGCSKPAPNPTTNAEQALKDAKLGDVKVDWDKDARIAHLKGTVDSVADRQRAEEVANSAVGTSGRVLNEVTVKGVNERTADDLDGRIKSDLKRAINEDQVLRDRDIDFDVNNGVVTVKGEVRTAAEKTRVSELVRGAPGVKDMANALEIKPKS